jgi:quercetin dioxygenase-like cupin family protein
VPPAASTGRGGLVDDREDAEGVNALAFGQVVEQARKPTLGTDAAGARPVPTLNLVADRVCAHSLDGKFACDNVENVPSSNAVLLDMGFTIMLLRRYWLLISTAAFLLCQVHLALAQGAKVTPLGAQPLPGFSGGEKEGAMFLVEYPPGASSAEHRHDAHVFVYVIEGSVVMQVKGGPELTLKAGETFYENPDDVHVVSRNASATEPAKFITFFVKTKGAPVVTPVK